VKWTAELPGESPSTPIIHGDHVLVTVSEHETHQLYAMCFDRKTGKKLWAHEVGAGTAPDGQRTNKSSPSAVTDGKLAIFFFSTGDLLAYTMDGKAVWRRNICADYGDFTFGWTFSSSPLLHDGKLHLMVLQRGEPYRAVRPGMKPGRDSFILAMEPDTGKTIWKVERDSEAQAESREAFSSIIPFTHGGRTELLVTGGDCVTGHDPQTGKELWRWGTWNPQRIGHWRLVPSAVGGGGVILACAPKGGAVYAIKAGLEGDQSGKDSALAWTSDDRAVTSDVATPAFYKGRFYVLNTDGRAISCIEPDGKIVWQDTRLPGRQRYQASPTIADGKIYIVNFDSEIAVLDAESGEVLHDVQIDKTVQWNRPTIAVSQGNLFVKVKDKLYCIGE
jgi:outer membrane protein assembly factor BamB